MKFNISCPETGANKMVELQNEDKLNELIDKKIGDEIDGKVISETFEGYTFKIVGGFDKDGFAMKNGVLTQAKKRILLTKGDSMFRFKRGYHRSGVRKRKLVRGCIVSNDIKILHLKVVKKGANSIPGLTEKENEVPKRLGPKRATRILKQFGLSEVYNEKKKNKEQRKNIRYMITKFAPKREVKTKNGKVYVKKAKIQRLITPERLRRKRVLKAIKKERREQAEEEKKKYESELKSLQGNKTKKEKKEKK
jgi:small subunit ribosomal protein S6e